MRCRAVMAPASIIAGKTVAESIALASLTRGIHVGLDVISEPDELRLNLQAAESYSGYCRLSQLFVDSRTIEMEASLPGPIA